MAKRKAEDNKKIEVVGDPIRNEQGKIGYIEVPGEILLAWSGKPWQSRPKKLAILVALYLVFYLVSLWVFPDLGLFLILIPLLLFGSASSHLTNSFYVITSEGVYWKNFLNQMFKPWIGIENFIFEDEMGELFFEKGTVRSRIQRNMPIYYDKNRDMVEKLIRQNHERAWVDIRAKYQINEDKIRSEVIAKLEQLEKGKKDE